MSKVIFVAWSSWDIWSYLIKNLEFRIENGYDLKLVNISGRDNILNIEKQIKDSFDIDWENILINAIWTWVYGMSDELDSKDFEKSFEWNFYVPVKIFQTFTRINKEFSTKEYKKINSLILNINSKSALEPFPQGWAYNSAKAAISMFLKVLWKENSKYWLKVKEIYPWVIQTKMIDNMPYIPKNWVQSLWEFIEDIINLLWLKLIEKK